MKSRAEKTATERLREWWLSPPRPGVQRLIAPPEYRHLHAFGITRVAGGIVATAVGIVGLSYAAYGWAVFFLIVAVLDLAAGWWELTIARSREFREASRPQS
jgi:MFS family permease